MYRKIENVLAHSDSAYTQVLLRLYPFTLNVCSLVYLVRL
jgi:hypothetical protein